MKKRSTIIAWITVVGWMGMIFYFSHQPASASRELSISTSRMIIEMIASILPVEIEVQTIHTSIRKSAHFFAYLTLGILMMYAIGKDRKNIFFALVICFIYAISDEIHQFFVPGRAMEVRDVIIDTIGAIVGISLYLGVRYVRNRAKE